MASRVSPRLRLIPVASLILVLVPTGTAFAQEAPPHPIAVRTADLPAPEVVAVTPQELTLEALVAEALAHNPELQAAGSRFAAAAQRPDRAASLPDPSAAFVFRNVGFPGLSLGDEMMSVVGLRFSQSLPARGKRPQRRTVAERAVDVAAARVEAIRRRLLQQITTAYHDLIFVHESIAIVQETRRLLLDLEDTAESRYAVGEGIQQDVLKGQVEISVLLNRLVQLEQQRDALEARLNRLAGMPSSRDLGRPTASAIELTDLDLDPLLAEAADASAIVAERDERLRQQQEAVKLARLDLRPDLMLSGAYMNRGDLPGIWEINVGMTLPIRRAQRQDRAIEEALQELAGRRSDRSSTTQSVEHVVRDSFLAADRAVRLSRLYRDAIIPQAVLSLESALAGYGVGNVDFLTVLDNVVTLLTYRLELAREAAAYAKALARIEEHLGRSLGASPDAVWARPIGSVAEGGSR